jgi:hypothetical protein
MKIAKHPQTEGKTMTPLQELLNLVKEFPPLPFMAFTMNPQTHAVLKTQCKPDERIHNFGQDFNGLEVWSVPGQAQDCLQWNDKRALRNYLIRMGVLEDEE